MYNKPQILSLEDEAICCAKSYNRQCCTPYESQPLCSRRGWFRFSSLTSMFFAILAFSLLGGGNNQSWLFMTKTVEYPSMPFLYNVSISEYHNLDGTIDIDTCLLATTNYEPIGSYRCNEGIDFAQELLPLYTPFNISLISGVDEHKGDVRGTIVTGGIILITTFIFFLFNCCCCPCSPESRRRKIVDAAANTLFQSAHNNNPVGGGGSNSSIPTSVQPWPLITQQQQLANNDTNMISTQQGGVATSATTSDLSVSSSSSSRSSSINFCFYFVVFFFFLLGSSIILSGAGTYDRYVNRPLSMARYSSSTSDLTNPNIIALKAYYVYPGSGYGLSVAGGSLGIVACFILLTFVWGFASRWLCCLRAGDEPLEAMKRNAGVMVTMVGVAFPVQQQQQQQYMNAPPPYPPSTGDFPQQQQQQQPSSSPPSYYLGGQPTIAAPVYNIPNGNAMPIPLPTGYTANTNYNMPQQPYYTAQPVTSSYGYQMNNNTTSSNPTTTNYSDIPEKQQQQQPPQQQPSAMVYGANPNQMYYQQQQPAIYPSAIMNSNINNGATIGYVPPGGGGIYPSFGNNTAVLSQQQQQQQQHSINGGGNMYPQFPSYQQPQRSAAYEDDPRMQ